MRTAQTETTAAGEQAQVRLAMIGLGPQGDEHLAAAAFSRSTVFVAGVDPVNSRRDHAASRYPSLARHLHAGIEALQGEQCDGLVLALPHDVYVALWPELLKMGKPMLKEKPLARSQEEAWSLLGAAREADCPVQTAIQRRHHPSYRHLRQQITESGERILEVHAHFHLGRVLPAIPLEAVKAAQQDNWRSDSARAGGGALLDAGYHMIDLLHHFVGPYELLSATMTSHGRLVASGGLEDRAWLTARSQGIWMTLDAWVSGLADPAHEGQCLKSEGLTVLTDRHVWRANREGVWLDGNTQPVFSAARTWEQAMARQLDIFAASITSRQWHAAAVWDQLPAMRIIDQAYHQSVAF